MNKKKILSLIMALVMLVGVFSPLTALAEGGEGATEGEGNTKKEVTKTVTLHKLVMKPEELKKWDKNFSDELEKKGYNATQDTDALKALLETGHSAHEVAGVYFAVKDSAGKYVTIKTATKENVKPEYGTVDSLDATLPEGFELLAGKTGEKGIEFKTGGLKGDYIIEEIHEKSSYVGEDGEAITDSKAVPVEITLPLVNNDGVVENAHVYPKNTEEKPQIDKNFLKNNELTAAEQEAADKLKVGADYNNYEAKKATAKAEIGKNIPYEVKTEIPAKSKLKEAHWDDKMTEGLTFNQDLTVKIGETTLVKDTHYTLDQDGRGFSLKLKDKGLALINDQNDAVTVELTYSATVNSKAIVDIPEANDITFHYGNTPSKGNTPLPTKPNDNGEVKVEKTWDEGSKFVDGEWAKFKLVDANTGEDVKAADLVNAPEDYKFEGTVTLSKGTTESYTWKYLNKDKQYKVVEVESKTLSDAEYTEAKDGTIKVTNHKSDNPKPLNPTEPKVVNGGKKFVKTDQEGKRLPGAEFYVKNAEGKYLVSNNQKDATAVTNAKAALDKAVDEYNNLTAEEQAGETGKTKKAAIDKAQEDYNKAFVENATEYKWEDKNTNAVVLRSDGQGRFEITGLEYGTYHLEEKTAPKGFAKLNGTVEFEVKKGSYTTIGDIDYNETLKEGETQTKAQKIENKKVSIPQTGGMGTVLFTIVGISLMAGAVVAMKRNREEA